MKTLEAIADSIGRIEGSGEIYEALCGLLDHVVVLRRLVEMQDTANSPKWNGGYRACCEDYLRMHNGDRPAQDTVKPVDPITTHWYERAMKAESTVREGINELSAVIGRERVERERADRAEEDLKTSLSKVCQLREQLKNETERADHNFRIEQKKAVRLMKAEDRIAALEAELRARCIAVPEEIST